jgi:CAAX prenyl protease-like protein
LENNAVVPQQQRRAGALPYVAPFLTFIAVLAVRQYLPVSELVLFAGWVALIAALLLTVSRRVIDLRMTRPAGTIAIGVAVFVIWIGPDLLFPGYRSHWPFQNGITGALGATVTEAGRLDPVIVTLRVIRAVVLVPILEELFWRAFMLRWIAQPDFEALPIGFYNTKSFWLVALLFASEHGPYWDVGLIAGILYNWWYGRARSLGDVIWAHAITNGCLCAYVLVAHKWEYWM